MDISGIKAVNSGPLTGLPGIAALFLMVFLTIACVGHGDATEGGDAAATGDYTMTGDAATTSQYAEEGDAAATRDAARSGVDGAAAAAAAQDEGTLVVLNKSAYTAMIIDMETREILATLPTGVAPHEADISPDGTLAVASNYGEYDGEPGNTLTVIDLQKNTVDRVIDLGEYTRPHGLAWLADGEHLVVTAEGKQAIIVLHVPSGEVVREIVTGQERSHIVALTAGQSRAYVANIDYGTLSVIDMENGEVITTIETGDGAEGIAISPDESELWITNRYEDTISVVDLGTHEVSATLQAGQFPIRATFTPDGRHLLVSNMQGGDVSVFDVANRTERMKIDLEPDSDQSAGPVGMQLIPGNRLLVAGTRTDRLYIIDLETFEITGHIPTGANPDGMAFTL